MLFKNTIPPFHHVAQKDAGQPNAFHVEKCLGFFNQSISLYVVPNGMMLSLISLLGKDRVEQSVSGIRGWGLL